MRIVICDDEKNTCGELENTLLRYANEKKVRLQIESLFSGEELLKYLQDEKIDILFLDIELPKKNGVEIGSYIRNVLQNDSIYLVYISSKVQYALELFQNRPFDFLIKPLKENCVYTVMDCILRVAGRSERFFEYQNSKGQLRIQYKDILYFQSTGRVINIVTVDEKLRFYGKLGDVEDKLPEYLFIKIHKSFLVNTDHVQEFAYEWVKMANGDILNISKPNRSKVRKKILEKVADELVNI